MTTAEFKRPKSYYDIPGFFWWLDRKVFSALLDAQAEQPPGDIVELGTYMGKSAVILGNHLRTDERLVALDLFGDGAAVDEQNRRENAKYKSLTRDLFEQYYLALHDTLPYIVQAPSDTIVDHVAPGTARFVHIDASHLYHHVAVDVRSTKLILRQDGIAVFDDYRSPHTPGVSAAVWEAVFKDGFTPFAITPQKMYGMFEGDAAPYVMALRELVNRVDSFRSVDEEVLGRTLLRITMTDNKKKVSERTISDADTERIAEAVLRRLNGEVTSGRLPSVLHRLREALKPGAIRRLRT